MSIFSPRPHCASKEKAGGWTLRALAAAFASAALFSAASVGHARAVLNTCSAPVDSGFKSSCEGHPGYQAVNLRLSGGGGCMDMCCKGDANSGYSCSSDPSSIVDRASSGVNTATTANSIVGRPDRAPKTIFISPTQSAAPRKK